MPEAKFCFEENTFYTDAFYTAPTTDKRKTPSPQETSTQKRSINLHETLSSPSFSRDITYVRYSSFSHNEKVMHRRDEGWYCGIIPLQFFSPGERLTSLTGYIPSAEYIKSSAWSSNWILASGNKKLPWRHCTCKRRLVRVNGDSQFSGPKILTHDIPFRYARTKISRETSVFQLFA
jgi:hypothetical protein